MATTTLFDRTGKDLGSVELNDELFAAPVNEAVLHQVVTAQLAGRRIGTHETKTRGEVRGGGKKPYRQKGTGRARQGTRTAPHYRGGGVVFGPHSRSCRNLTSTRSARPRTRMYDAPPTRAAPRRTASRWKGGGDSSRTISPARAPHSSDPCS